MTVTKVASVLRVLEQHFMKVLHRMRSTVPAIIMETMASSVVVIVPVRDRRVVISLVRAVTSVRDKVAISARAAISLARVVTSVRDKAVISLARVLISVRVRKVATSLVRDRVVISVLVDTNLIRSLMANLAVLIRRAPVSIRPTMIRMLSTA